MVHSISWYKDFIDGVNPSKLVIRDLNQFIGMIKNLDDKFKIQLGRILESKLSNQLVPGENYIPVTSKSLIKEDIINGIDSLLDCWLTTGRYNDMFERQLSEYIGCKAAITVNSGSSANLNAFYTLTPSLGKRRIQKGDEIITVAAGFQQH